MNKFISGLIGAFAALTIFGMTVSAAGGAVGDLFEGIGDAGEDVVNGVQTAVSDIIGGTNVTTDNILNEANNETSGETSVEGTTEVTNETTSPVTAAVAVTTTAARATDNNPRTGSFEIVTFGALALGSLAIAATTTRKRK